MRLGITGAGGFIGRRATALAAARGWEVTRFSRHPDDPSTRKFSLKEPTDVDGLDAVLHLAGESVFGLWTRSKRARIMDSRVEGTRRVVEGFAEAARPPQVLVSASGVGFYGNTGDLEADESSPVGHGFLADVCQAWEGEAARLLTARVVLLRIGLVFGQGGGTIKRALPVFRSGLGGKFGNGRQRMSCIHVDDVVGLVLWAIEDKLLSGPLNAVMPHPCRNAEFTDTLAKAVRRPAILPAPSFLLRLFLGQMSSLLLHSSRVRPAVAHERGYAYAFPQLTSALAAVVRG